MTTHVTEDASKREIVCKANISLEAIASLKDIHGVDVCGHVVGVALETIIVQAAFQARKHTGLSIEDTQKAIREVKMDTVAEQFGEMARNCSE